MNILILFGGPSPERGLSLNSARSLVDHLAHQETFSINLMFISQNLDFYVIDKVWLYCNTTDDFEFKVDDSMKKEGAELVAFLKHYDLLYPVLHGHFGEDGQIQAFFEQHDLPFVGSPASTGRLAFPKASALAEIAKLGFIAGPYLFLSPEHLGNNELIEHFLQDYPSKLGYIIKPNKGGSSLGVKRVSNLSEILIQINKFPETYRDGVVIELYYQAQEFCITVIETSPGTCCALIPCTIHYQAGEIFDYRKKYLPSTSSTIECPAKCSIKVYESIRVGAERLFQHLGCRHIARFDGWIFEDGRLAFSDINLVSGMEQNSLVFMQAAACGMSHQRLCEHIVNIATGFNFSIKSQRDHSKRKPVFVVCGGQTAERQVSLMSGSNVWLKLWSSRDYKPYPFLLGIDGRLYAVPYRLMLYHTVEELLMHLTTNNKTHSPLPLELRDLEQEQWSGLSYTVSEFTQYAKNQEAYVFLALHGGAGEDGTWQAALEAEGVPFNGSGVEGSRIGIDKVLTAQRINALNKSNLYGLKKIELTLDQYPTLEHLKNLEHLFQENVNSWIIKPRTDGCSTGIIVLQSFDDLKKYYEFYTEDAASIPAHTFHEQNDLVTLPAKKQELILEPYIQTDRVTIQKGKLNYERRTGWIELTQGVLEFSGLYHALEPSLAVTSGAVLSVEEKFQGGTGTNLTPVPFLSSEERSFLKKQICIAAQALCIKNYARFDLFYHKEHQKLIIIEVNTLPGLTPSTVLYHQGLAESPSLEPRAFLEKIIRQSWQEAQFYEMKENMHKSQAV